MPPSVRRFVEDRLGARVLNASTPSGGFSPGVASILSLNNGDRTFLKAIPSSSPRAYMHKREGELTAKFTPDVPSPRLRFAVTIDEWEVLCFDVAEGRLPEQPWRREDLTRVLAAADDLARLLTPSPRSALPPAETLLEELFNHWEQARRTGVVRGTRVEDLPKPLAVQVAHLAEVEEGWRESVAGETLLHGDLRFDNILISEENVAFVDWAWPSVGANWMDVVTFLPTVHQVDADLEALFLSTEVGRNADQAKVNACLVALAGMWTFHARDPAPQHAPHLRALQRASGLATLRWLVQRGVLPELGEGF